MIRALIENGYHLDIVVSNLSERDSSSKVIADRLSKRYKGANFIVRKHPSLLDNSQKDNEKKIYKSYKFTVFLDSLLLNKYKVFNFRLMPFNIRNTVEKMFQNDTYDLYYSNYLYNLPNFVKQFNVEIVSDIHDLQYRRIENDVIPSQSMLSALLYKLFFKNSELKRLKLVDKVISISPIESDLLKKLLPNKKIYTLPATADVTNIVPKLNPKYDFTFIGSNSDANRDSLLWFLDNCFENIVLKNRKVRFLIQGRIIRNKLIKENEVLLKYINRNIVVSDFVEFLSDVYADTKVIICPIVKGSGMKIKVIEALSYSKAIVGTDIAFEGINVKDNEHVLYANDPKLFSEHVFELISNGGKRKLLEKKAGEIFKEEYSFDSCVKRIKKVIH